jgi:indole-3-glycerol phosphate synthase
MALATVEIPNEHTRTQTEAQPRSPWLPPVRVTGALAPILATTRQRVAGLRASRDALRLAAERAAAPPPFADALRGDAVAVIAEVKRRSPSAGAIAQRLSPGAHARAYSAGGASAISVLTDEVYFGGSLADLDAVREAVALPLLRKDFILDELQLYEARAHGASAVLLIVRALEPLRLRDLAQAARELGLAPLVEVHHRDELDRALAVEPGAVGVNARDLDTFRVEMERMEPILRAVPAGVTAIAESGLRRRPDVERVAAWGADAVLIGSAFAAAADPEGAVRGCTGVARRGRAP